MLFLNILTVILLALVAGLLLTLWVSLRAWRVSAVESPMLAERLAEQLLGARRGLDELKKALVVVAPEVSKLLSEGRKMQVDLEFVVRRAEQVATDLERASEQKVMNGGKVEAKVVTVQVAETVRLDSEAVAGANGKAVQVSAVAHDPLEDLLAGLQAATGENGEKNEQIVRKGLGGKRRTPVTQAELDLQQKVQGPMGQGRA